MELITIKKNTADWDFMWLWLELHPINADIEEPCICNNNNETWEYIGTYKNKNKAISEFRHKNHPKTNNILILSVEHPNLDVNSIQTSSNIC